MSNRQTQQLTLAFLHFRAALLGIKLSFSHQARLVTGNRMGTIEMIILDGHMGHMNLIVALQYV